MNCRSCRVKMNHSSHHVKSEGFARRWVKKVTPSDLPLRVEQYGCPECGSLRIRVNNVSGEKLVARRYQGWGK